jgi:hypothetical protein
MALKWNSRLHGETGSRTRCKGGGTVIDPTEYAKRAEAHKPRTPAEIASAARNLAREGYGDHTIAKILNLDVVSARRLIGESHAG